MDKTRLILLLIILGIFGVEAFKSRPHPDTTTAPVITTYIWDFRAPVVVSQMGLPKEQTGPIYYTHNGVDVNFLMPGGQHAVYHDVNPAICTHNKDQVYELSLSFNGPNSLDGAYRCASRLIKEWNLNGQSLLDKWLERTRNTYNFDQLTADQRDFELINYDNPFPRVGVTIHLTSADPRPWMVILQIDFCAF